MKCFVQINYLVAMTAWLLLSACSNDYTDLSTKYTSGLCVVKQNEGLPVYLQTDDSLQLHPVSTLDSTIYRPGNRYLVTYVLMDRVSVSGSAYSAKVLEMQPVLIKDAILRANIPSGAGSDPVNLISEPWVGGGFLNFEFSFRNNDASIKHSIWLVCDSMTLEGGCRKWYLTFLHAANNDKAVKTTSSLYSFPCSSIASFDTTDSLIVNALEWATNGKAKHSTYRIRNNALLSGK